MHREREGRKRKTRPRCGRAGRSCAVFLRGVDGGDLSSVHLPSVCASSRKRKIPTAKKRGRQKTVYIEDIIAENKELGTNSCSEFFCFKDVPNFLTEDLNDILDQLPKELRIVSELLKEENILTASKILGISRGSLRNNIKKIRKFFNSKGIKNTSDFL